jgi:FkbM family methyltransferase
MTQPDGLTRLAQRADNYSMALKDLIRKARKAALLAREEEWRRGLAAGTAASVEHDCLPLRSTYRSVIDVGANRGQFALYARTRFPAADVYCLEPLSGARSQLTRLFAQDQHVHVIAAAAGSEPGSANINVSKADDSSSLLAPAALQTQRFPGTEVVGVEQVEVQTLDELFASRQLEGPMLLKLDVQGFELEALRGARKLLKRVDTVLTECSFVPFYEGQPLFDEVLNHLRKAGFTLVAGTISSQHKGRWEQGDFVFEKSAAGAGKQAKAA